jgi:tRNA modification GTPase
LKEILLPVKVQRKRPVTESRPSYGSQEPIAALATTPGESALALIRTSGGGAGGETQSAVDLVAEVFSRPSRLREAPGNSIVRGWIVNPAGSGEAEKIDEVLVSVYRSPRSYTGEDGVDISCHGGPAVVRGILEVLKKAGFREALPGEFTFRAFMNGKLDLTRSESVMELVAAKTGRAREQAVRRLSGVLEKEIQAVRDLLVQVLAGTEIYLDYSEDEFTAPGDEAAGRLPGRNLAKEAAARLESLSASWRRERLYAEGALAVIAGRPNAGKSSLFNYLVKEERSIVTSSPGTTRDWIEALVSIRDIPLHLVDTAGLRDLEHGDAGEAERLGIRRSRDLLEKGDLVLYVIDGTAGLTGEDREFIAACDSRKPLLLLWNKSDISSPPPSLQAVLPAGLLKISAKTGEGIASLDQAMAGILEAGADVSPGDFCPQGRDAAGPGTLRQKELLDAALATVTEALDLAEKGEPLDIIAPLFRTAVEALAEITGEVSTTDILDAMFSRFCVGK